MRILLTGAAVFALALLAALVWRLSSRRRSLPCPAWLRWMVELDNPFTRTNRAAVILEHLNLQPGMRVLDAGCGPGRLTIPAARRVGKRGEATALDLQAGMLARVRIRAEAEQLDNIRFLQAGLGEGKLETDYFDRALLVTVLGEIPDRKSALTEILRALKPGGVLSITEVIFDPHFQRRGVVARLAQEAGFEQAARFGNRIAYTTHFRKPVDSDAEDC